MPFLPAIGVAVAGFFGAATIGTFTAGLIGGAIVGAAVGGLYSAFTGGNILKGMLFGAVGGAVIGGGAVALGFGGAPMGSVLSTTTGQVVGGTGIISGATSFGASENAAMAMGAGAKTAGGGWFTSANVQAIGAVAQLGNGFLKGGMQGGDNSDMIASNEKIAMEKLAAEERMTDKQIEAQLAAAGMQAEAAAARTEAEKEMHGKSLAFDKEKFRKEFDELVYQDRADRDEVTRKREAIRQGIYGASEYVAGNTQVAGLVQSNRQRRNLPSPNWYVGQTQTGQAQQGQQQQQPAGGQPPQPVVAQNATPTGQPTPAPAAPVQNTGIIGAV